MGRKGEEAKALFEQGYNCAQAVACAFAPEMGLTQETAARLASAFGGGLGRLRETCGTVSGMAFVIGMLRGYQDPQDIAGKKETYALMQKLAGRFREKNGSLICRELLGLDKAEGSPEPSPRTPEYYRKRPCGELARCAAAILEEELNI